LFSILSGLVLSLTELHENEIASGQWASSFSTNSKYVGLIGDFNSRTGEDDVYVNVNFEHDDNNIGEFIENHLHENEIASGQWMSEKRQLKSCTVKFTND
jgi:hypothetical protein